MSFGENIKAIRKSHNLTQKDLAQALGITTSAVSAWERDDALPSSKRLQALSDYFGIASDVLMSQSGDNPAMKAISLFRHDKNKDPKPVAVPYPVWRSHRHAVVYDYDVSMGMGNIFPDGCQIVVNPVDIPKNVDLVLVKSSDTGELHIARFMMASSTVVIDFKDDELGEMVYSSIDEFFESWNLCGQVVWYQAATILNK